MGGILAVINMESGDASVGFDLKDSEAIDRRLDHCRIWWRSLQREVATRYVHELLQIANKRAG